MISSSGPVSSHLIDKGMELADRVGCHAKLRALRADLERQHAEMIEQRGAEPPVHKTTHWSRFRSGNYASIISRYVELEASVVPRGILGPAEEREFWALAQFMIRISLVNRETQDALTPDAQI